MESHHFITDRHGVTYRVQSEPDDYGWSFHLWHGDRAIGYMHCVKQPPTLMVGDFKLYDDVRMTESMPEMVWRRLLRRAPPICNYRHRGIGSAMLVLLSDLAKSAGFCRLEGWISDVDTNDNPTLPEWYRRHGFDVTLGAGKYPHQVATIFKEL